ncbi:transient receptor potential cation channel subfamily M member 1 [Biomphalaria glabrata]|nr:transient receptor potential cation channel subfamily M member 1-like [Biomphalaria glabrata]
MNIHNGAENVFHNVGYSFEIEKLDDVKSLLTRHHHCFINNLRWYFIAAGMAYQKSIPSKDNSNSISTRSLSQQVQELTVNGIITARPGTAGMLSRHMLDDFRPPVSRLDCRRRKRSDVHANGWNKSIGELRSFSSTGSFNTLPSQIFMLDVSQRSWVEKTFVKRECIKFIPSLRDTTRCSCGRNEYWHRQTGASWLESGHLEKWHPLKHTEPKPTDAYGTIEFQGGPHPSKAQYMRLSSLDTRQDNVLTLLFKHWGLDLPKLLITVHGGILNFELQPKLKRVFRKGLLKAARTTGAWIVTNGTNTGVTKHVGDAISDRTTKTHNKVVAIGITQWGIVENKESLIGRDKVVPYHCVSSTKSNSSVLNNNHSYFVLVDNGTVGKYGGEILFRKKFEKYIAQQKIGIGSGFRGHSVPVICVVLEGGANTIRSVLEYVTDTPPVPVVVCDGSGRAADLLAFAHKYTMDDGTMAECLRDQLILTIQRTFMYSQEQAEKLFIEIMLCVKKKELITVFRMGDNEDSKDIDLAILTALLKGTTANPIDQLNLALTWDRVDIARSHIFVYGQEWPEGALEVAMMDALINDRVDFVKLLLENGVSMHTFLTIPRLEDLYNCRQGPTNSLRYLIRDVKKNVPSNYYYTLPDIGLVLQFLIGGGFRSSYCRKVFKKRYYAFKHKASSVTTLMNSFSQPLNTKQAEVLLMYPFHDLMIWAVLMRRQKMALFMWQHGEEAMAKALIAGKLYSAMAHEAEQDGSEIEQSFRAHSEEFLNLALELLNHCYKIDDDYTQQLLTYELKNFSDQTCLGLAVLANHRQFIAHTCCQMLLNDLWIGGLCMRKYSTIKVILGIIFPPFLFALDFKTKEELQLMPQTVEEHLDELEDASSADNISMCSLSEDQDPSFEEDRAEPIGQVNLLAISKENCNVESIVEGGNATVEHFVSPIAYGKKKSPLRMGKKAYEFYNAPITKFWVHFLGYLFFLSIYFYVILDRLKEIPTWAEIYVTVCIFTTAGEKIRQIVASEPVTLEMKLNVYISKVWNILDTLCIVLFFMGFALRFFPSTLNDSQMIYCLDSVFWNIKMLEIYSVNKYLGPFVKIMGKLLKDMCYLLTIVFLAVTCYGIVRQTVLYQNKEVSWPMRLRNVWFYPYWNIYGELFAEEIDPCDLESNRDSQGNCTVYASWLAPACMCIFMLVANILVINLLIARFNATFIHNNANSKEIWMFQRYSLVLQYEMRPILPPPFILVTHIYLAFKYIRHRCKGKRTYYDNGLKLFLSYEDTEKLHDFEEECLEDLHREKDLRHQSSAEERLKCIVDRVENMSLRLDDINMKENHLQLTLGVLEHHMSRFDDLERCLSETLTLVDSLTGRAESNSAESLEKNTQMTTNHLSSTCKRSFKSSFRHVPSQHHESLFQSGIVDKNEKDNLSRKDNQSFPNDGSQETFGDVYSFDSCNNFNLATNPNVLKDSKMIDDMMKPMCIATAPKKNSLVHQNDLNMSPASQEEKPQNQPNTCSQTVFIRQEQEDNLREKIQAASFYVDSTDIADINKSISSSVSRNCSLRDKNFSIGQPLTVNTSISQAVFNHSSLPQSSACFTSNNQDKNPPCMMWSFLTPTIGEYTSITDTITSSCFKDCPPPCSPVAQSSIMFTLGDNFNEIDGKHKDISSVDYKQMELKKAEEIEHQGMETIIRRRLHQISQDERGSISDIAKVVVAEFSAGDLKQTSQEDSGSEIMSILTQEEYESNEALDLQELVDSMIVPSMILAEQDNIQFEES